MTVKQYCGSGIRCFFVPGNGIRQRFYPDLGSPIPKHISESIVTVFNWLKLLSVPVKNKINYDFVKFVISYPGFRMGKHQVPGSEISILDPKHCSKGW
jgi:hypothetical protein